MPRYEFSEGSSNKFWEITLDGNSFTTTYGRLGTDGQSTTKEFDSPDKAKKEFDKLVAEKVKKGYQLVGEGAAAAAAPAAAAKPAKAAKGKARGDAAQNSELEEALVNNPDDGDAFQVYGDWLQAQGDPRGELCAVQAGLKREPGNKELAAREKAILEKHDKYLRGGLADADQVKLEWRYGHIYSARVATEYDAEEDGAKLVKKLLALPAARLLVKLTVGLVDTDGQNDYSATVKAIAAERREALRELFLGDFEYPDELEMSWSSLGDLSKLWEQVPRLEKLTLQSGGSVKFGTIDLPALKHFEMRTGGLDAKSIKAIASARWPYLETLIVWFGSSDYGASGGVKDIRPILDGVGLPRLKHLGLMNAEFTDELCTALVKAKILPQLEELDLSKGTMTSAGARVLAENKQAFSHLQHIHVEDNLLDTGDKKVLAGFGGALHFGEQRDDDSDDEGHRYVSVGE